MKKLMTTIAAATMAFGLFAQVADLTEKEVDFTSMDPGTYNWKAGDEDNDVLWSAAETAEITAEVKEGEDGENYLAFEGDELTRLATVKPDEDTLNTVEIGEGVEFDQSVKFSAFEEAPSDLAADAKIAVWLMATDTETNLYVSTASLSADAFAPTEQDVKIEGVDITPDQFYDLSITAIPAYTTKQGDVIPGFVISVDGKELTGAAGLFPTEPDFGTVTPEAEALIDAGKLFPSRVAYDEAAGGELTGVAFKGTGSIKKVGVWAHTAPVTTYTLAVTAPSEEEGTLETDPAAGQITAGTTVTVTAKPAEGYELVSITTNGVALAEGETEFVMPAENVTVAATFKAESKDWPDPEDPAIKDKTAKEAFGDKVPNDLANVPAKKFAAWAKKAGINFENPEGITKDAYLLDCAPDKVNEEKAKFKIVSIEFIDDEWVVKVTGEKAEGDDYTPNAKVVINDITETLDSEAKGATDAKGFFRATLDFND